MTDTLRMNLGKGRPAPTTGPGEKPAEDQPAKDQTFDELDTSDGSLHVRVCVMQRVTPPEGKPHTLAEVRIQGRG
jgi:hypothetical protein